MARGRLTTEVARGVYGVRAIGAQAYLVAGATITVIDTGTRGSANRIIAAIEEIGRSPRDVSCVVVTHAHLDHVGGLPALQRLIDAPAAAHVADVPAITSPEPLPNPFQRAALARVSGPVMRWLDPGPARIDLPLEDGVRLPGSGDIEVIHMPGHTPGSICLYSREHRMVFAGDAMEFRRGRLTPPSRYFTGDMPRARASIRGLARIEFDALCLSHFPPILQGAGDLVGSLARAWEGEAG